MTIPVPVAPPLSRLPRVELMHAGTWSASTGVHTFATEDFGNAVAALDCPAVRRPVLKLGHTDPRFDGQPAAGFVSNMAVTDGGSTLVGDYEGMPGWLGPVLASAYPDRSVEGTWDYKCAIGHLHPFVLTAVALLGTQEPAIGTLTSLQDVGAMYGVVAASAPSGPAFSIHLKGATMPNPNPRTVALGVTTEDVRRAYYDTADWPMWIEEMHLDPLQLIVTNDDDGSRSRIPITVSGDGAEGVTFGDPVPVVVRYEDVSAANEVAASSAPTTLRFASRAESRPGASPRASTTSALAAEGEQTGGSDVELTDEQATALREALGLAEDADAAAIVTAVEDQATAPDAAASATADTPTAVAASAAKLGLQLVDPAALEARLARGDQAFARLEREDREKEVDAAMSRGAIVPARRDAFLKLMAADKEGTTALLRSFPDELAVPIKEIGHNVAASADATDVRDSDIYKNWS